MAADLLSLKGKLGFKNGALHRDVSKVVPTLLSAFEIQQNDQRGIEALQKFRMLTYLLHARAMLHLHHVNTDEIDAVLRHIGFTDDLPQHDYSKCDTGMNQAARPRGGSL